MSQGRNLDTRTQLVVPLQPARPIISRHSARGKTAPSVRQLTVARLVATIVCRLRLP